MTSSFSVDKRFITRLLTVLASLAFLGACSEDSGTQTTAPVDAVEAATDPSSSLEAAVITVENDFDYEAGRFADIRMLRYQVPGFEGLSDQQKELLYYLSQAALSGRDIMYDQNYKHNLRIRRTLEEVLKNYAGDRDTENFGHLTTYAKQVWFANGIHHHYSGLKFTPLFDEEYFNEVINAAAPESSFPLRDDQSIEQLIAELTPILFDQNLDPKKVNTADGVDKVTTSAVNFYEGVTEQEVVDFYAAQSETDDSTPISHGLNSKLVKVDGEIVERVWHVGGMYSEALEQVVYWLERAIGVAENDKQRTTFELLVKYYRSGDLEDFDAYNIAWVADTDSAIDVINGFIEVYNDPLGYRGSFESVVSFRDAEATLRISAIGERAQWFEDNSPIQEEHKKADVTGIDGKVITVVMESGDSSPATPIGINLPNSSWIRAEHGSKSVSLGNIVSAYNSSPSKTLEEFAFTEEEILRSRTYSEQAGDLHTDMHEVIGHASGRINEGVGTTRETLRQYASTLEEGRADLVALYYIMDPMLIEIGVMDSLDVGRSEYDAYIRGGAMLQLYRLQPGELVEEAHMRNRQLVALWSYEQGLEENVIERVVRDGKTFFVVNDYEKLREIFGRLLQEIQRIKSEGDFEAARDLVENYGTQVDEELHAEVLRRYATLDVAPYSGFVNPRIAADDENGVVSNVRVEYPNDFMSQMLEYAANYSFLPTDN
ncbi:MAG: dihydrofolate reductase [SAR86 cluster bacterium]|uniref:Dihydrofolate reductase n=1 Tax=SAR86 cluster bacterium TaxID=2030880 RepID=A0A2A4X511_9GAMM|nr:MAG: dihydrofolate reductase [SAR86 cluster bacterium]